MSTLVTTNLKHGGAAGNNIVLNSDGSTTVSGALTLGTSPLAVPSGAAPSYTCRAWVNFNGSGTVAIRASGNVSSITDNGTGNYTVNFTTAMPDANYATVASAATGVFASGVAGTTGAVEVLTRAVSTATAIDSSTTNVAVFR